MPRILIVDDETDWCDESLKTPLLPLDYEIITTKERSKAFDLVRSNVFDLVILNIRLSHLSDDAITPHKITSQWTELLDVIRLREFEVIVVTAKSFPPSIELHRLQRMAFKDYDVADFLIKDEFNVREYRQIVRSIIDKQQEQDRIENEKGGERMDWNTAIALAVSTVSPYTVALATSAATAAGKEMVEATSESIKRLWQWISQTVGKSNDKTAKEAWENFKRDPQENKQLLIDIVQRLVPDDDAVLREHMRELIQEAQSKEARLISLLDNDRHYIFDDLKRICSRVSAQWEGRVGSQTQEGLARWVVNHAITRNKLQDLIIAMLEVNPTIMTL